jgi:hypothetical protein
MKLTDAYGNISGQFSDGDPLIPVRGTLIDAAWLNDVQNEIVHIIEEAGLTPTRGVQQLMDAIQHGALKDALIILNGVADESDKQVVQFGSSGPPRVKMTIIDGVIWFTWNASFNNGAGTWQRDAAGDSYAFAFGYGANAISEGHQAPAKFYRRDSGASSPWLSGLWPEPSGAAGTGIVLATSGAQQPTVTGTGWSAINTVKIEKTAQGRVFMDGKVRDSDGTHSTATVFTIDAAFRPSVAKVFYTGTTIGSGGLTTVTVNTNGTVVITHPGGSLGDVWLDGMNWSS